MVTPMSSTGGPPSAEVSTHSSTSLTLIRIRASLRITSWYAADGRHSVGAFEHDRATRWLQ
jgi:hypothetical protein